ncbi:pilus assembly protein TadG-related protein [Kribbia dieselivorans]|uniref:pilus assembly protein TadG-related protein n=1 Tax=Kribbia dieselivorans TaxID=331526 RepID=UPI000838A92E|nr:pilus assembly protein TadG-related protein [Kribbia dieselivorans]
MTSVSRAERGQVTTMLTMLVTVLLCAFTVGYIVRVAKATDERSQIQIAADAAALAGAKDVKDTAPALLPQVATGQQRFTCGLGRGAAADFASRNDATLVSYCYYPNSDRIEVRVRMNTVAESGRHEDARAVAKVGKRLGPCALVPLPPPPPTPSPTSTPTPTDPEEEPPPPPDVERTARCGDVDVPLTFPGDGGRPYSTFDAGVLAGQLKPSLID